MVIETFLAASEYCTTKWPCDKKSTRPVFVDEAGETATGKLNFQARSS